VFDVDLHAHTRFFHWAEGRPTPFDPVGARALALVSRWRGLDGVALTNHDYYTALSAGGDTPVFLPGIEVSTTRGHALVVGPDPPAYTKPGALTPGEVVSIAHDAGCAAIIPHPYRRGTVLDSQAGFDAVEINGKHPASADQVRQLATDLDLPIVAGSDAHFPFEAGRAYTRIDADELTPESVVEAIRDGRVEPKVKRGTSQRLLQRAYHYIHRAKRRTKGEALLPSGW
jgi:predicted metal-dependent phosphoesterase TrpH